ncbi:MULTISPECIES: hypothetical protein [unclassified Mesorhizobium]|uniref:hypothetical protein n=1 Tax=unclassified Mesorhizobium TaxID=325217 RepID=UPI000FCC7D1E|nr:MULTISPECIES: hypothetical protein [unclassified Mesorhizobium]RUV63194.1 hypothetical protein EOA85_04055 [Mesorhizobium sp. M5C.F.Ca.IN.020.29.1.1]RWJ02498.1 MAG: hypothetical protein EOR23_21090 [Mesorhizobium sp.]RWJ30435.1 MAG: hypothetical protein EOR28_18275 [Mesorhizobium sp.]TIP75384.1 MAG: hypothetical protein E5X55_04230 [Mesorhizobium sp.]TIQ63872.1 MAG: hypothetical protein E5X41_20080 [Mesorhizobium sp.]
MISRAQFFVLTKLDSDGLSALKRRNQLPVINAADREYSPFEAFAYLIAERLVDAPDGHGMNRSMAAEIVRDAASLIARRGPDIEASAPMFRYGDGSADHYAGRLHVATEQFSRSDAFVGTKAELAETLAGAGTVFGVNVTNITASFVLLQRRAAGEGIDISGMWPDPASLPTAEDRVQRIAANWRAAITKTNNDRGFGEE